MSLMSIKDLITSDPYYQNLVNPRGFPTGNDVYVPPTTPNPTPEPGIPSIVNPYLPPPYIPPNQGGGDRDDGNTNVIGGYKDYGYKSPTTNEIGFNLNDIREGTIDDDYNSPIGFNIDDIADGTINDEDMPKGLFEQLSNLNIQTPGKFALDLINKGITNVGDYFANRKAEKIAEEKAAEETRIRNEKIAEETRIRNEQIEANSRISQQQQAALDAAYQRQTQRQREAGGGSGGQFDGASSKGEYDSNPTGFSGSFRDGGIASMFTRRR